MIHPAALVPFKRYVLFETGLTVKLLAVDKTVNGCKILDQVYVLVPVVESVAALPKQIVLFGPALTTGNGLTTTARVDEFSTQEFLVT